MDKEGMQKYFFTPRLLEEIINTATIVVDTNVLLSAYQWKEAAFKEVLEVLKRASKNNRLKIPAHVLEEFMDQRPKLIQGAIERINTDIYSKIQKPNKLSSTIPLLGLLSKHDEYIELEEKYLLSYKLYRGKLEELSSEMRGFFQKDPVLISLKPILEDACFTNIDKQDKKLNNEAENRLAKKKPPLTGGDSGKKENKYGDYYIWQDILSLDNDVIFVSTDFKEDWYYLDSKKKPLSPRRELIEEFYELNSGRTCCIVSLTDYIKAIEPSTSEEIISDLSANQIVNNLFTSDRKTKQVFEIEYLMPEDSDDETFYRNLLSEINSVLYFFYDVRSFEFSNPYLDVHSNGREFTYIKINNPDREINPLELLNHIKENSRGLNMLYGISNIKEIENDDNIQYRIY
ncbi:hypothetical protein D3C74_183230 [compost metagenome]